MTYLVSFNIATEQMRNNLVAALKEFGSYCPIHRNCWAIETSGNAVAVRDKLQSVIGPTDSLFVIRSGTEAAWLNSYGEANNKWLKEKL